MLKEASISLKWITFAVDLTHRPAEKVFADVTLQKTDFPI
jgi:hypothetical protein